MTTFTQIAAFPADLSACGCGCCLPAGDGGMDQVALAHARGSGGLAEYCASWKDLSDSCRQRCYDNNSPMATALFTRRSPAIKE